MGKGGRRREEKHERRRPRGSLGKTVEDRMNADHCGNVCAQVQTHVPGLVVSTTLAFMTRE